MRVLMANHDDRLAASITPVLEQGGLALHAVPDCEGAQALMRERHFDALLLDRAVTPLAADAFVRGLRARSDRTPVMVLIRDCPVAERVQLLDLGVDDYLGRPFDPLELCARLRALIRRSSAGTGDRLEHGPLVLLRHTRVATVAGRRVELTNREFWILDVLMRNARRSMSRRQLEEALYGWGEEVESNAIEVHIHHLRRKLGAGLILTVRGVGYQLADAMAAAREAQAES